MREGVYMSADEGGDGDDGVRRKKPIQPPDFSAIPGGDSWEGSGWEDVANKRRKSRDAKQRSDFTRREPERAEFPRRVRGGLRVEASSWPMRLGVFGGPIAGLVDELVPAAVRDEAFTDYAQRGQVKTMGVGRGVVEAQVQGRRYKAYSVSVRFRVYSGEAWDGLVSGMDARPQLAAKLIAGDVPEEFIEFAASSGVALHPSAEEVSRETTSAEEGAFDKHSACVLMLLAERVEREPELLLALRGLTLEELTERLRQRRAVTASSVGAAAAYDPPRLPEAESASGPLDADLEGFWDAGPGLWRVEAPLRRPEVSHPILRRLGPSPFEEGRFPLVGLLATCYDTISEAALRDPSEEADGSAAGGVRGESGDGRAQGGSGGPGEGGGPQRVTRSRVKAKAKKRG